MTEPGWTFIGGQIIDWLPSQPQPPNQNRLTPPQSGPAPQNPPLVGSRIPQAVLNSWLPPPPQPPQARNFARPASGPTPQNPPFIGPLQARIHIQLIDWIPPPPMPIKAVLLNPPISGPLVAQPGVTAALQNLFNQIIAGTNTTFCDFDLYTITLFDGTVLRSTTADFDISSGGNLYSSSGVRVDQKESKVQAHWKIGLDVDTWTVVFMPRPTDPVTGASLPDTVLGVPWAQAAHSGAFDAADFQVDRAWFSTLPTWPMPPTGSIPVGTKTMFAGVVGAVDVTSTTVIFTVNDYRSLFSIPMPRHFWQGQCRHTLFDVGCNADGNMLRSSFQVNGTAGAGSTQSSIVAPTLATPSGSGTYALGTIVMTGGQNKNFSRTIASWDGMNLKLVIPLPYPVVAGDTFNASPGCDLQRTTCAAFNNSQNFGGQPFIPAPENIV